MIQRATAVAQALASSDTAALDRLCHDDVFIWGTDEDEVWHGKAALLTAFPGAYNLKVHWVEEPTAGSQWVAGVVEFESEDEETVRARVSMVFTEGLLAHAHYSVARVTL